MTTLSQHDGAKYLAEEIQKNIPFAAGKLGTSELNAIFFFMAYRRSSAKRPYPSTIIEHMTVNAGIFPANSDALDSWADYMLKTVLPNMDIVVKWIQSEQEQIVLRFASPRAIYVPLRSLEPYYENNLTDRWTYNIPDRSIVAVITPFVDTLQLQWKKRDKIWPGNTVWPSSITLVPIRCFYPSTVATESAPTVWQQAILEKGWMTAVVSMVTQVKEAKATIAIVGCGALSLPVVVALKAQGITAVHTGGATQILFGIKGKRWETHATISKLFNESWIGPLKHEVPSGCSKVEGGCYW